MQLPTCLKSLNMRFSPRLLSSVAAVAFTCLASAAAYYYRSRKTEVNKVMIFCKLQYNVFNYFDTLISYIESAKQSVHVCMPSIHNPAIQGRLVELIKRRKNIKIRIIIDGAGYNDSTSFLLKELAEAGAEIKWKVSEYRMQHKFCLVDDDLLITGTLNWGNDLSWDNWNYVYVTSKSQLVEPVKRKFYEMWDTCQRSVQEVLEDNGGVTEILPEEVAQDNLSENYELIEPLLPEFTDKGTRESTPVIEIEGAA